MKIEIILIIFLREVQKDQYKKLKCHIFTRDKPEWNPGHKPEK